MKKIKKDFSIDFYNNEKIDIVFYRNELKKVKNKNYYFTEIADFYYQNKYNKNIYDVMSELFLNELPMCPIKKEPTRILKKNSSLVYGEFSPNCTKGEMCKYVSENNVEYKKHIEKMKTERLGVGNPMYGLKAWNRGLTKDINEVVNKMSENRKGIVFTEETIKKMSESAKIRKVHGHTGMKHSEESKQIMRQKTIERLRSGAFPQTNSLPHKIIKSALTEFYGEVNVGFEEEFEYGGFVFDFKIDDNLLEIQGDFFHCNPNTRFKTPKSEIQINNLKRDERKRKFVFDDKKYNLIELWEYDIVNNLNEIKECLKVLKK